jgi:hypothetical protein
MLSHSHFSNGPHVDDDFSRKTMGVWGTGKQDGTLVGNDALEKEVNAGGQFLMADLRIEADFGQTAGIACLLW